LSEFPAGSESSINSTLNWRNIENKSQTEAKDLKGDYMQKITPFLWFDGKAEEAMNFYISIFKNSKIVSVNRYGEAGPGPKGTVMTAKFELNRS
jgi:3-demethylubiquinone-9 3-methyltransferase